MQPEPVLIDAGAGILVTPPADVAIATKTGAFIGRRLDVDFWLAVGWLALVILLAILAGNLPLPDPTAIGASKPHQLPSSAHFFGTDELGRDLFSRIIFGARVSLTVGSVAITFGMLVGGTIGLLAGYYRGIPDAILSAVSSVLLAFPSLIFLLSVVTFLGRSLFTVTLALGILSIAPLARIIRANTITYSNREFVLAARALGAKDARILVREILPNVLPGALAFSLVAVAITIVVEGALSFLGLSVAPPTPTWGGMISEGGQVIAQDPRVAFFASFAMFSTVLALNFAGDRLQSYFQVREGAL